MDQHPRDFVGYGATPPDPKWPGGARLAVQIVMNYEEGSEYAIGEGDESSEMYLTEVPGATLGPGKRDPIGRLRGLLARLALDRVPEHGRGRGARPDEARDRFDRADDRDAPVRLVLPLRPLGQHAPAGRRRGRVSVRLRRLQRRSAVLDARRRQAALGDPVHAGQQRHEVFGRARLYVRRGILQLPEGCVRRFVP